MKKIIFNRDPRQFDSSEFFLGISIILFSFNHYIGGTISLIISILIWIIYKKFTSYIKENSKND